MTTTTTDFSALNKAKSSTSTNAPSTTAKTDTSGADRFLTLLVAQMKNQDPLNPLDNAQVTSQLAQINTVSGINQLNASVTGLSAQYLQQQTMQAVSLVGRDVVVPGNRVAITSDTGTGGFTLDGPADRVQLQVYDATGDSVGNLELGAAASGQHGFSWPADGAVDSANLTFKIVASQKGTPVTASGLMSDRVAAVTTGQDQLTLELLHSGTTPYTTIQAFN